MVEKLMKGDVVKIEPAASEGQFFIEVRPSSGGVIYPVGPNTSLTPEKALDVLRSILTHNPGTGG